MEDLNWEKLGVNILIKYKILKIEDFKFYIIDLNDKILDYKLKFLNSFIIIDESFK